MPDNKVALFIDFDNIRIGIRQHFGGELHPQKLMAKASKYGRVVTAKAYADFTGHPKEFQDRLLFAAGIEPIHAPSKISGGRRQSSADMHMVIDMFLEAIDNQGIDTFILMTGDADFVRMVATLRRRFGKKVIISGVQSTSTSLDLMNAADARDPITKQDVDMTGELGRMTRPLVTRADLDAQAIAEAEERPKRGSIFGGIFKRKTAAPAESTPAPAPAPAPLPPAPRRMRATELRGGRTATATGGATRDRTATTTGTAGGRAAAPSRTPAGRGRQAQELPPVGPGSEPDDFEKKLIEEIFTMPPGRSGYKTIKTIEETLRSKAGRLGGTRKEIPARLDRLEAMGLFKRETRSRGAVEVPAGELVLDNPVVLKLTAGLSQPEAKPRVARSPRTPRRALVPAETETLAAGPDDAETAVETEARSETAPEVEVEAMTEPEAAPAAEALIHVEPEPVAAPPPDIEPAEAEPVGEPFRWVSGAPSEGAAAEEPADGTAKKAPAKRAPRKTATSRAKSGAARSTRKTTTAEEAADKDKEPA